MRVEVQGLDPDRMVVLSLKPRFAEAILAGAKTVELRRTEPKIVVPTQALLYAASPVRALVGTCIITSVQPLDLVTLWQEHGSGSGLLHHEFQEYFEGVDAGTALTLTQPRAFGRQIPLQDLRGEAQGLPPAPELRLRRHRDRRPAHPDGRLAPQLVVAPAARTICRPDRSFRQADVRADPTYAPQCPYPNPDAPEVTYDDAEWAVDFFPSSGKHIPVRGISARDARLSWWSGTDHSWLY